MGAADQIEVVAFQEVLNIKNANQIIIRIVWKIFWNVSKIQNAKPIVRQPGQCRIQKRTTLRDRSHSNRQPPGPGPTFRFQMQSCFVWENSICFLFFRFEMLFLFSNSILKFFEDFTRGGRRAGRHQGHPWAAAIFVQQIWFCQIYPKNVETIWIQKYFCKR